MAELTKEEVVALGHAQAAGHRRKAATNRAGSEPAKPEWNQTALDA